MKLKKNLSSTTTFKIKQAAKSLFAAKGFETVTVKEIGLKSRTNPALINYHFGGKRDLYFAIIEDFASMSREHARALLRSPKDQQMFVENLDLYIRHLLRQFLEDPDLHLILSREFENGVTKSTLQLFQTHLLDIFERLEEYYHTAKKLKLLKSSIDPRAITMLLFSSLAMVCQRNDLHAKFIGLDLKKKESFETIASTLLELFGHGPCANTTLKTIG